VITWPTLAPLLSDGVVSIGPWLLSDIDWITQTCQDPAIQAFTLVPSPYTRHDAEVFIADICPYELDHGIALHLALRDAVSAELLGAVALEREEQTGDAGLVGYWLSPLARGRGIATRAVAQIVAFAKGLGFEKISLHILEGNDASRSVAHRAGFSFTTYLLEPEKRNGVVHRVACYELRS
jgi:RimJ/RimL family protein N-acetyltransferase